MICAARVPVLDVVHRLLDWQKTQVREGLKLTYYHSSLFLPVELIEIVIEFAV